MAVIQIFIYSFVMLTLHQDLLGAQFPPAFYNDDQLRYTLEQEAEEAAATIDTWLTYELSDLLVTQDNSLNDNELDKLSRGQCIVLIGWATYSQYTSLVCMHLGHFFDYNQNTIVALIKYNFGNDFFENLVASPLLKQFKNENNFEIFDRFKKRIHQLMHLKSKLVHMTKQELEDELKNFDSITQDCFFHLRYPERHFILVDILAYSDDLELIRLLLEFGFDVNAQLRRDKDYRDTLLTRAVRDEHVEMVSLLLDWGADPMIYYKDHYGLYKDNKIVFWPAGVSPWELNLHIMKYGKTWDEIEPCTPESEKSQKIHEMLSAVVSQNYKGLYDIID